MDETYINVKAQWKYYFFISKQMVRTTLDIGGSLYVIGEFWFSDY